MVRRSGRCFAVVPAAGRSHRMGTPKLLLSWRGGKLIDQVLRAWTSSRVDGIAVVVHPDDHALHQRCDGWPVKVVVPAQPPRDMKHSLQIGLRVLEEQYHPNSNDRCFIAPADLPTLSSRIIDRLIDTFSDRATIVAPKFGDHQGHPILLPWPLTTEVFDLPEDQGVNRIVARHSLRLVPFEAGDRITDVDTPEQYLAAIRRQQRQS